MKHDEVAGFVRRLDRQFDGNLRGQLNYSRVVALAHSAESIERLSLRPQAHVGVVSGSKHEPELLLLDPRQLTLLNFDGGDEYDLDRSWQDTESLGFSLTLCNQVLEHVFNPHIAFQNLVHHTAVGGYVYVNVPTINCVHGEPYFYSSGFHPRFLERLALDSGLRVAMLGAWGSRRYLLNAVIGNWLTERQLTRGPHRFKDFQFPSEILRDGRKNDPAYITDCWGLFRKEG